MTEDDQKRLIAAGFTADELRQLVETLSFTVVVAEAGEESGAVPIGPLAPEKMDALFAFIRDLKADE